VTKRYQIPQVSFGLFTVGLAALIAGSGKALSHGFFQNGILQSICGSDMTLDQAFWLLQNSQHCWGCPVALAGLGIMTASLLLHARPDRSDAPESAGMHGHFQGA
jgi:hypothetical protein